MRIGAIIPNAGPLPGQLGVAQMAQAAEGAGAASLWVSDHLVLSKASLRITRIARTVTSPGMRAGTTSRRSRCAHISRPSRIPARSARPF